jgi:type I restriction enzyme S subunit
VKFVDGLPEGWNRYKISNFYNTTSGGTPSRSNSRYYENATIPWIKTGELQDSLIISTEENITEEAIKNSSAKKIPADTVLMAMYGVNIGKLAYTCIEATCNQACCVFRDKKDFSTKHYLFQYLKSIREYLLLISFGAAQQNLSQDLIKNVKIIMPSDEILKAFETAISPVFKEIKNLLLKNQNLIKQRDLLLPRLMSGKLQVH